jgi:serine/threonine protein kinase
MDSDGWGPSVVGPYHFQRQIYTANRSNKTVRVWTAIRKGSDPQVVAVKIVIPHSETSVDKQECKANVLNEIQIMRHLNGGPNLIRFVDEIHIDGLENPGLVTDYCSGGSLLEKMVAAKKLVAPLPNSARPSNGRLPSGFTGSEVRAYFSQMVSAVNYLHSRNVAHLDIKLDNFVLREDGSLFLIDMEMAVLVPETPMQYYYTRASGTVGYAPPEIYRNGPYDARAVDTWCLGACLFLMTFGVYPYGYQSGQRLHHFHSTVLEFPSFVGDQQSRDLMVLMLNFSPSRRIPISEVMSNSYVLPQAHSLSARSAGRPLPSEITEPAPLPGPAPSEAGSRVSDQPPDPVPESTQPAGGFEPVHPDDQGFVVRFAHKATRLFQRRRARNITLVPIIVTGPSAS